MLRRWLSGGLLAACAVGCGPSADRDATPGYLPDWPEARAALTAALEDWRASPPPLVEPRQLPGVVFADKQRRPGDRLRSFAILGQTEGESVRQFTVRLEIEGDDAPRLVRYNVLGRDPVWVFRLEDYEMISHWQHPMDESEAPPPAPSAAHAGHPEPRPAPPL
jgi:hypothetical protein